MADLSWMHQPFAHRGLHKSLNNIIENSPSAITAAMEKGFAIEVDLQPDQNNEPVVFHDQVLDRLTHEKGHLKDRVLKDLRRVYYRGTSDCIIGLDDLLNLVRGSVPLIIEIKSQWIPNPEFIESITRLLDIYRGKFALMSFDPRIMLIVREIAPDIPNGLVAERFRDQAHWSSLNFMQRFMLRHLLWCLRLRSDFIAYDIRGLPSLAPFLFRWLWRRPVLTWTVKSDKQYARAIRWADAVIFEKISPQ